MQAKTSSRIHKNKVHLLPKKFTLKVSLDFQFGFELTFIFALLVFKVHQHLDFVLTSSVFRRLELARTIVAKPTVVGTMLLT
jgi:hypothetical protein